MTKTKLAAKKYYHRNSEPGNEFKVAVIDEEGYAIFNGSVWLRFGLDEFLRKMSKIADDDFLSCPDDFFHEIYECASMLLNCVIAFGGEYDHLIRIFPGQDPWEVLSGYSE